jgi:hypothetical protein
MEAVLQAAAIPWQLGMPLVCNCFATCFVKCVQAENVGAACVAESGNALV